jgi:hypothetical protein
MSANDSLIGRRSRNGTVKESRTAATTAAMLTMDQNGVDDLMLMQKAPTTEERFVDEQDSLDPKPSWWKRGLATLRKVASDDNDEEEKEADADGDREAAEAHYKALEEGGQTPRFVASNSNEGLTSLRGSPRVLRESLLESNERRGLAVVDVLADGAVSATKQGSTREDALQKDCSFFYRSHDDVEESQNRGDKHRRRFRALRHEEHQHGFAYRYQNAVDVLTPSFLNEFQTRYQQLNHVDASPLHVPADHELVLTESEGNLAQIQRIVRSDTTITSSIFYLHHDGRILMRLPMDAVRLVMDPDLEAGILSVEQWRQEKENMGLPPSPEAAFEDRPPLRYALTVSPDLYRRVVAEMSDEFTNPFCGFSRCCSDNGKADIRIAVAILGVVLVVLFINTVYWGPVG